MLAFLISLLIFFSPGALADPSDDDGMADREDRGALQHLERAQADQDYRVGPGDVLYVEVFGETDLTGSFPVTDKGVVDFPLLGNVSVAEKNPHEIGQHLVGLLDGRFLRDPRVTVSVETYHSRKVQVLGAVKSPGVYFLKGPTSVLVMLTEAGGISAEGVVEIRLVRAGLSEPITISVDALMSRRQGDLMLQGGDTIYVPEGLLVFVSGNVEKPGSVAYRDGMTALQVVNAVGGPSATGSLKRAYILREGQRLDIDLKRVQRGRMADMMIQPGDQLYVPESVF